MTMTWELSVEHSGTRVEIRADDVPGGLTPDENAAEEMALWLIIEDAELRVQHMHDLMPDQIDGLPEHPDDHTWDDCRDYLFYDRDILFLFNENLAGVEDPDNPMNDIVPDIADYRPKSWFAPFWGGEHRHPERPTYEQAVAQRRKDSP